MFLRAKVRKKDGKDHRYFSVVENRRVGWKRKRMAQRTVLYLGEINDGQEATWRKSLQVFDESCHQYSTLSLFPEDREIPAEGSQSIQVKLSEMELRWPRMFGNCWLGCELWRQLQLQEFWEEKLSSRVQRETVSWEKVLRLFRAQKPAGLIVTGINQTAESRTILESMNCPVTQIMEIGDSPVDMMVGFSHYDAAFAAISHILEQGRRRIGFLGARMDPRVQRRLEGYRDAMKAASLFDPSLVVTTSVPTTVTLGRTLFTDLLAQAPDIDAVFCVNYDLALGTLFECQRRGIGVPDDLAIIGFNDLEFCASAYPALS